jgi:ubiquinone/menaquinone biosynthesis C-methylase UbiE
MDADEARGLLAPALAGTGTGERWADLGAGSGTFTAVLATLLGPTGHVWAMDRDRQAVRDLHALPPRRDAAPVTPLLGDFTDTAALDALRQAAGPLDGVLVANALHFVTTPLAALGAIASLVRHGGRVVVIEYDRRRASRWVPFPISSARLVSLVEQARLGTPTVVATTPSAYGGELYVAVTTVP